MCSDLRSDTTVRKAATDRNDARMIAVVSRELVAAEGHYHRSCYRQYTCRYSGRTSETHQAPSDSDTTDDSDSDYYTVEKHCYDRLFDFIRNAVFEEPQVVKLSDLTNNLVGWLLERRRLGSCSLETPAATCACSW